MKDKSYTRDCTKQTSEFPQLQNIDLNLLTISFHLLFVYQTSTVVVVVAVVVVDFFNACMFFFPCALSNSHVSDCNRYLYKKCLKFCLEVF